MVGVKVVNICIVGLFKIEGMGDEIYVNVIIVEFFRYLNVWGVVLFCIDIDLRRFFEGV